MLVLEERAWDRCCSTKYIYVVLVYRVSMFQCVFCGSRDHNKLHVQHQYSMYVCVGSLYPWITTDIPGNTYIHAHMLYQVPGTVTCDIM